MPSPDLFFKNPIAYFQLLIVESYILGFTVLQIETIFGTDAVFSFKVIDFELLCLEVYENEL